MSDSCAICTGDIEDNWAFASDEGVAPYVHSIETTDDDHEAIPTRFRDALIEQGELVVPSNEAYILAKALLKGDS